MNWTFNVVLWTFMGVRHAWAFHNLSKQNDCGPKVVYMMIRNNVLFVCFFINIMKESIIYVYLQVVPVPVADPGFPVGGVDLVEGVPTP